MEETRLHPLEQFNYCPKCGGVQFVVNNVKSKRCLSCGFVYYFNPSAAVACFIRDAKGGSLVVRRAKDPAKGTLDLAGGFVDSYETAEEAAAREIFEETGLKINGIEFLFSLPNIYRYSGFDVHTVDMFFECRVDSFEGSVPADDVAELLEVNMPEIDPSLFGLDSIRKGVEIYKKGNGR